MEKQVFEQIEKLINGVNDCVIDDELKGYKASPLLKKIDELLHKNFDEDKNYLSFAYHTNLFIAEAYKRMGRFSLAALYEEKALDIILKYAQILNTNDSDVIPLLQGLLRDRNYYINDDCQDLYDKLKATNIIEPDLLQRIFDRLRARRRTLTHDPVEMSEAYLAVIDEVEEKIDQNRTFKGMGSCFEIWDLKQQYLLEKGIHWKSPSALNPRVMFD